MSPVVRQVLPAVLLPVVLLTALLMDPGQAGGQSGPAAVGTPTAALPDTPLVGSSGLPRLLAWRDAQLYRSIFRLQEAGDLAAADALIGKLSDRVLIGHVQAQRYLHPTAHRSTFPELRDWLSLYGDHPEADRIYRLAVKRKPSEAPAPAKPTFRIRGAVAASDGAGLRYRSPRARSDADWDAVRETQRAIRKQVTERALTAAERHLQSAGARSLLDPVEQDQSRDRIAWGWLLEGENEIALRVAEQAAARSGLDVPRAHWTAGLAAWRLGRFGAATRHFAAATESPRASDWLAAAGAFWAGRAHDKLGHTGHSLRWYMEAAAFKHTFYGLLALRKLRMPMEFDFRTPRFSPNVMARLGRLPQAQRAFALYQTGARRRAEAELLGLGSFAEAKLAGSILALAEAARIPSMSFKLASRLAGGSGTLAGLSLDGARYPLPPWRPATGFRVDRALVFAFMRHESNFDARAKSKDGALGLMQIMPTTADYISGKTFSGGREDKLLDPRLNIDLGQRYLAYLLDHRFVKGDLFRLAAAYNGGPGNLQKWEQRMGPQADPLMFIETLPSGETRGFIERVLTNFWIYRARLGQPMPSLDSLADGGWPRYDPIDAEARAHAAKARSSHGKD